MAVRYRNSLNVPPILVDIKAYEDMLYIARSVKVEVAWFCEVERLEDGTLIIGDVHLPEQQSSSTTVEIEPDDLFKFADAFIAEHGAEKYNTLRAWGHSHHTMGVSPSHQDQKMLDWMIDNNGSEFFLAIRINHKGEMQVDYATRHGLTFEDTKYTLGSHPALQEWWAEQVKAKLRPISYTSKALPPVTGPYYGTKGTYYGGKAEAPAARAPSPIVYDDEWDDRKTYDNDMFGREIRSPAERSKVIDSIKVEDLNLDLAEILNAEHPDALMVISDAIDEVLWQRGINYGLFPQGEMWGYAERKYEEILTFAAEAALDAEGGTDDHSPTPPA